MGEEEGERVESAAEGVAGSEREGKCVGDWEGEALGEPVGEGERELTPPPRPPLLAVGL